MPFPRLVTIGTQHIDGKLKSPDWNATEIRIRAGGSSGPIAPHNFYERQFKPALKRAMCDENGEPRKDKDAPKFDDVTIHTLRHTFGSIKLEQGENLIYVSKQMGHASPSITANVYAHLLKARRPEARGENRHVPIWPAKSTRPGCLRLSFGELLARC